MQDGRWQRRFLAADFVLSFMWVWSGVLVTIFVQKLIGYGAHQLEGDVVRYAISILNMFFFAFMSKVTKGGAYNPLTVLADAVLGDFSNFLFTVGARIPAQVVGSVYGVRLILNTLHGMVHGPRLTVDIAKGALTEGFLTFGIVIITLGLSRPGSRGFLMNTWISCTSKLSLHILGSDLTGGCMNPAAVMGWAFAQGEHITKEHLVVYWLAPVLATLAAVWVFNIIAKPTTGEAPKAKPGKSD
ncbi:probable aquaporin SIP2-1 [Andrographis paniculata]|uniref:probable aquaporin SIP2-1 n=1 Tax=Andrographis paniculata TaxID=175694 RepID=UPI0021E700A3|nr:probable aquaporin SIP2-1 [Andrographis paniculata]